MNSRREIILGGSAVAAVWLPGLSQAAIAQAASSGTFEIVKSDEEWRRELTSEQYGVLRRHQTERHCGQSRLTDNRGALVSKLTVFSRPRALLGSRRLCL